MTDALRFGVGGSGLALLLALPVALVSCSGGTDATTPVTPAPPGWGLLSSGLRDKTLWPFDSTSIWNTAIGSGAVY